MKLADVLAGLRLAWHTKPGDLLTSGAMLAALTLVILFGSEPIGLGLVLVAGVLLNASRILYSAVKEARESRELDAYWDGVFAHKAATWFDPEGWDGPEVTYVSDTANL